MIVCIAGLGLIGGSLAIDLRKRGFASSIIGVDNDPQHAAIAQLGGLVDETDTLENAVKRADFIILATPVDAIGKLLPQVLDQVGGTQKVVTDMGSTKAGMGRLVKKHANRRHYVASHPMAGTEFSGPLAAVSKLFDYKCALICDKEQSASFALKIVRKMYKVLNMKIIYMNSDEHDMSAAYVSHISHISSFALSLCVLEKEKDKKRILSLAGGGFASTVRLAKSSAEMWAPVFEQNSEYVIEVLNTYIDKLQLFKEHIEKNQRTEVNSLIREANKIQKILS
ncbi:MAG: prephenate dehydrogenase [Bacteroidales bacterium]|nr:prephenate dehydrogenase [Bacteroidales bacterium]